LGGMGGILNGLRRQKWGIVGQWVVKDHERLTAAKITMGGKRGGTKRRRGSGDGP